MKAEEAMEALVAPRKDWTPAQLRAEYDRFYDGWIGAMGALQDEPMASTVSPLADLGSPSDAPGRECLRLRSLLPSAHRPARPRRAR